MAKRHKLAGNGVDLVTTLTRADLASIVASCATASTGCSSGRFRVRFTSRTTRRSVRWGSLSVDG